MFQKKKVIYDVRDNDAYDQYKKVWEQFIQIIHKAVDPILYSMLYESIFVNYDQPKQVVHIRILKKFMIFQDLFTTYKATYQAFLERCFGAKVILFVDFYQEEKQKKVSLEEVKPVVLEQVKKVISGKLDISDKEKWELTHTLLKHFGGTISDLGKDTHEQDA